MYEVPGSPVTAVHITEDVARDILPPHYEHGEPEIQQEEVQANTGVEQPEESTVQL